MIRTAFVRASIACLLLASMPALVGAQDEAATSPEGIEWQLIGYGVDGEIGVVPWSVGASLLLEDGTATGSTGCNRFNGTYQLEGGSLTFDETFAVTRAACPDPQAAVEGAYLANLPQTASWAIEDGVLSLADAEGAPLLDFEAEALALSANDVAALVGLFESQQAQIDRLGERVDNIRIGVLRDRIKTLEDEVESLRSSAASSGSGTSFTSAENVLLKGIPNRVRKSCSPIRGSRLPAGTVAAVACDGVRQNVATMAYYLMEYDDAVATLRTVARANDVPKRRPKCSQQQASWFDLGIPVGAEACWVGDGAANVRLIAPAANCQRLDVGGTVMQEPAIYLALEGTNRRLEPLRAAGLAYTDAQTYLLNFEVFRGIPSDNQPTTRACRALLQ